MKTQAERFLDLFHGGADHAHGEMKVDRETGDKISATTARGPLTVKMIEGHLQAGKGVGAIPIGRDGLARFGAIDVDEKRPGREVDHAAIAQKVEDLGLPLVVTRSKSGGAGLWLFLTEPLEAKVVRRALERWARSLGAKSYDEAGREQPVEIFPKQETLGGNDDGNWINLPLTGDGKRPAWIGGSWSNVVAEFVLLAENRRTDRGGLIETANPFERGPTCLQEHHAAGVTKGIRNEFLFRAAIYFRLRYPADWKDRLEDYDKAHVSPPLGDGKKDSKGRTPLDVLIKQVESKDYAYPQCLFGAERCTGACETAEFGRVAAEIAAGTGGGRIPKLTNLRRVEQDPAYWLVEVNGRDVTVNATEFLNLGHFRKAVLEQINLDLGPMTSRAFAAIRVRLLNDCRTIDLGPDVGIFGQFKEHLHEYLARPVREAVTDREELLVGDPIVEDVEGGGRRLLFRTSALLDYLKGKRFNHYTEGNISRPLREISAKPTRVRVGGDVVRAWSLPAEFVGELGGGREVEAEEIL